MGRQSTCINSLYFGAGQLMHASSLYVSCAVKESLTIAFVGVVAVRCTSSLRFGFISCFYVS